MALSSDLISQFVKTTKDDSAQQAETTVYGTIQISDNKTYVQIDGSTLYTPVTSTSDVKNGDRVMVLIKDHTAIVTGNMTSPSVNNDTKLDNGNGTSTTISEFGIVVADKVSTSQLNAETARIDTLYTDVLDVHNVEVDGELVAKSAKIETLEAKNAEFDKVTTDVLDVTFVNVGGEIVAKSAVIDSLEATSGEFHTLQSDYAEFKNLAVTKADIQELEADVAEVKELSADHATIEQLDAVAATVGHLQADVADIDTLIFGTASGDTIHTDFANAVIARLGDAQIKSAMIESISASKIDAGTINTNDITVKSEDGKLLISDETIQIRDATNEVRVQIGKDDSGDYSINIWDADGNLILSEGGITDNAIKNPIIRDDMVSDTANINAKKIDISSLFEEINGSEKTIKSSKIYLDGADQTLEVAFTSLTTDVEGLSNDITSQGTQITAIQGKIDSKIWQQDIDTATNTMSTKYSELEQDLSGFKTTVSETYTTKEKFDDLDIGGRNLLFNSSFTSNADSWDLVGEPFGTSEPVTVGPVTISGNAANNYFTGAKSTSEISGIEWLPNTQYTVNVNVDVSSVVYDSTQGGGNFVTVAVTYDDGTTVETGIVTNTNYEVDGVRSVTTASDKSVVSIDFRRKKRWAGGTITLAYSFGTGGGFVEKYGRQCAHIHQSEFGKIQNAGQLILDRLAPGTTYTLSAWVLTENIVKGTTNASVMFYQDGYYYPDGETKTWFGYGNTAFPVNDGKGEWEYITSTFTTDNRLDTATSYRLYVFTRDITGDVYFCNLKLEKGNKATDWTPAPEDTDDKIDSEIVALNTKISTMETSVKQEAGSIVMSALEKYVEQGEGTEYDSFKKSTESALSVLSDQISGAVTDYTTKLDALDDDLQTKYNLITKYFTFNINGLEIGALDENGEPSPYRVVIDNDRYSMYVNGTEALWFDADGFGFIPELTIDRRFNLLGLDITKDNTTGNIDCEYLEV